MHGPCAAAVVAISAVAARSIIAFIIIAAFAIVLAAFLSLPSRRDRRVPPSPLPPTLIRSFFAYSRGRISR